MSTGNSMKSGFLKQRRSEMFFFVLFCVHMSELLGHVIQMTAPVTKDAGANV